MKKYFFLLTLLLFAMQCLSQGYKWANYSWSVTNVISEGGPVTIDKSGNVYGLNFVWPQIAAPVLSTKYGPYTIIDSQFEDQGVVYCLDSTGKYKWAIGTQGAQAFLDVIHNDDAGNIYVMGSKRVTDVMTLGGLTLSTTSYPAYYDHFIAKINSAGHAIWIKDLPVEFTVTDFNVTHSGDIYFTGCVVGGILFGSSNITYSGIGNVIAGKYDSSFTPQWALTFGDDSSSIGREISVSENGSIFIAGQYSSLTMIIGHDTLIRPSGPTKYYFVAKIDTGRNLVWGKSIYSGSITDFLSGIAADNLDNIYIAGTYYNTISTGSDSLPSTPNSRLFLFRYDSAGNVKWVRTIADNLLHNASTMDVDYCGNIWISGQGGHPGAYSVDQMFLAHYDSSGNLLDTLFLDSGGDDGNWVKLDKKGNFYVSGDYGINHFALGDNILPPIGTLDETMFTAKYIYDFPNCTRDTIPYHIKTSISAISDQNISISVFPNPATDEVTIHSETPFPNGTNIELYDLTGRLTNTYHLSGNNTEISTATIPPGLYLCRIYTGGNEPITRKLVILK